MIKKTILWILAIIILLYIVYVTFLIAVIIFLQNPKEGFDIFIVFKLFGIIISTLPIAIYWSIKERFKGK